MRTPCCLVAAGTLLLTALCCGNPWLPCRAGAAVTTPAQLGNGAPGQPSAAQALATQALATQALATQARATPAVASQAQVATGERAAVGLVAVPGPWRSGLRLAVDVAASPAPFGESSWRPWADAFPAGWPVTPVLREGAPAGSAALPAAAAIDLVSPPRRAR